MTDPIAAEQVETAIRRFDEALNCAGFRTRSSGDSLTDWAWSGRLGPEREPVTITLPAGFPFAMPVVVLPHRAGRSDWHQTAGGALCLWSTHSKGDLPWLEVPGLVRRIEEWITNAEAGWADDAPQLDLEAYNNPRIQGRGQQLNVPLLVVEKWDEIAGHWFRAKQPRDTGLVELIGAHRPVPPAPRRQRSGKRKRARHGRRPTPERFLDGLAVDLGEMTTPLVSSDELFGALGKHAGRVGDLLDAGRPVLVAARYTRSAVQGLIGFWLEREGQGLSRECFHLAEREAAQHRRAGWHADAIQDRKVSVIGAGSVGSYVADLLHRSGIRDLVVHDWDVLLPGNLVRHASSPQFVGAPKTAAIRDTAAQRDPAWLIRTDKSVTDLDAAVKLLRERDLVVDCTGDRLTWQMMLAAAEIVGVPFLHVMVVGHGQFGRVDVCPPRNASASLPPDPVVSVSLTQREGGCGDPVSPTPPTAVVETAAMGARFAIRILAGEDVSPAGETREMFPVSR